MHSVYNYLKVATENDGVGMYNIGKVLKIVLIIIIIDGGYWLKSVK